MDVSGTRPAIAFSDHTLIAAGNLADIAVAAKPFADAAATDVLVLDAETSQPIELDLRGGIDDVAARYRPAAGAEPPEVAAPAAEPPAPRSPGRPKLGVVAREVTLLPRHWEWLASQPGGASVTLRKLVEQARRDGSAADRQRAAQDSACLFMTTLAGNEPGYEEATRALYACDGQRFAELTEPWPTDVRDHARRLAAPAFSAGDE